MRHATVYAIETLRLLPPRQEHWVAASDIKACDWTPAPPPPCGPQPPLSEYEDNTFRSYAADLLLAGREVQLPTCPACAALVDLALELRGG